MVRMQCEAEETGLLGAVHVLDAYKEIVGQSPLHVYSVFLFAKSFQIMEAIASLNNY